jgi:small-conductance mechanosensitive channel
LDVGLGEKSLRSLHCESGIFFMADDAFRVGEYVDTGRLKGTVEKITVRSVQLRHQSGLVHTVPFGQLQAITNASRDWATVKFNIRLERGIDLEQTRKIIKRVGQQMLEDAELAPEIIAGAHAQAGKSQGSRGGAEAQQILAAKLVERAQQVMLVAQPASVLRDDGRTIAVDANPERIAPLAAAPDVDRAVVPASRALVENPAHLNLRFPPHER